MNCTFNVITTCRVPSPSSVITCSYSSCGCHQPSYSSCTPAGRGDHDVAAEHGHTTGRVERDATGRCSFRPRPDARFVGLLVVSSGNASECCFVRSGEVQRVAAAGVPYHDAGGLSCVTVTVGFGSASLTHCERELWHNYSRKWMPQAASRSSTKRPLESS